MKKITEYKAIILDLDGTLYYQKPVQMSMAFDLMKHYLLHPFKIKELFMIMDYRKAHEDKTIDQYQVVASKYKKDITEVKSIIDEWMISKPLKYIYKYRDAELLMWVNKLRDKGVKIAIYSDYPIEEKLKALKLNVNYEFTAQNPEINALKPDKKGIEYIVSIIDLPVEDILFVGDRFEKDGKSAESVRMDYIILDSKRDYTNWN